MSSQSINVTDRQTDGQTTCDPKTALYTKVHRAVIVTTRPDKAILVTVADLTFITLLAAAAPHCQAV